MNVDEYISGFPADVQVLLQILRSEIKHAAPESTEVISYKMPAYMQDGPLVYFAAYKNHIGFYPTSSAIKAFSKEISRYKNAKGSVQFPIDEPLPLSLVRKMVKYKLEENRSKTKTRSTKK